MLIVEPLDRSHHRTNFKCGIEALDRYLKQQATQDIRRRVSRVFVACNDDDPSRVLGYYTLSTLSIELSDLPDDLARRLPRHAIPAALVGRLAVDAGGQGQGIGKMLLANAVTRTLAVSDDIGIHAIVVDAINDAAVTFYRRFGFSLLARGENRLFLPLKSV